MANPRHIARLKKGVEIWNRWLKRQKPREGPPFLADLTGEDFSESNLFGVVFENVDCAGVRFGGAILNQATIKNCRFAAATLTGVSLCGAFLVDSDFTDCDLTEADLVAVRVRRCDFSRSTFARGNLFEARFEASNLSDVEWEGAHLQDATFPDCQI